MKTFVLNGWAAKPCAWERCHFARDRVFSCIEQLDGEVETALAGETRVFLVGWSMGGASALAAACRHPEKIAGLVLVAATARMMEEKESGWRGMSPRRLDALAYGLRATKGEGLFGLPPDWPNPYDVSDEENLARGIRFLLETDLRADLLRVFGGQPPRFPVAIFQSEHDGVVRPENADFLAHVFPHAETTRVPGSEHALPLAAAEAIDAAVRRFTSI